MFGKAQLEVQEKTVLRYLKMILNTLSSVQLPAKKQSSKI